MLGAELESALSPEAVTGGGGVAYLEGLASSKEKFDSLHANAVKEGQALVTLFSQPPVDPTNPASKFNEQLGVIQELKDTVDTLWAESRRASDDGGHVGSKPEPVASDEVGVATVQSSEAEKKGSRRDSLSTQSSERFSELEEQAYEVRGRGRGGVVSVFLACLCWL